MLIVYVLDSGKGIDRQDIGKLFCRFGKLKQPDPKINSKGVGLGLAICEAIIAKNDGIITIKKPIPLVESASGSMKLT